MDRRKVDLRSIRQNRSSYHSNNAVTKVIHHSMKIDQQMYDLRLTFILKNDMEISVFDIFKIVAIPKNKITSIATDSTHVYISCKDGKLMIYELNDRMS